MVMAYLKNLAMVGLVAGVANLCPSCSTEPTLEINWWEAVESAGSVVVTVAYQEGWCPDRAPYHVPPKIHLERRNKVSGVLTCYYDGVVDPTGGYTCVGTWVTREVGNNHVGFTTDLDGRSPYDYTFQVFFEWEGEGTGDHTYLTPVFECEEESE
jgi:hypothetical protein